MPTKKIAIFVEGQTESIFVKNLVQEIFGVDSVTIRDITLKGRFGIVQIAEPDSDLTYFVLIVNCEGGEMVKSRIRANLRHLEEANYEWIVGLYDLFPMGRETAERVKAARYVGLEHSQIPIRLALAVMEIEAWFLREAKHYRKIHEDLTLERIRLHVGFDPETGDPELVDHPSETLHEIYSLVGLHYEKKRWQVQRTVYALDYGDMYLLQRQAVTHFGEFVEYLEEAFA